MSTPRDSFGDFMIGQAVSNDQKLSKLRAEVSRLRSLAGCGCWDNIDAPVPPAKCQSQARQIASLTTERNNLADAIVNAAIAAGIIDGPRYLTGPELILLCENLAGVRPETVVSELCRSNFHVDCYVDCSCYCHDGPRLLSSG